MLHFTRQTWVRSCADPNLWVPFETAACGVRAQAGKQTTVLGWFAVVRVRHRAAVPLGLRPTPYSHNQLSQGGRYERRTVDETQR